MSSFSSSVFIFLLCFTINLSTHFVLFIVELAFYCTRFLTLIFFSYLDFCQFVLSQNGFWLSKKKFFFFFQHFTIICFHVYGQFSKFVHAKALCACWVLELKSQKNQLLVMQTPTVKTDTHHRHDEAPFTSTKRLHSTVAFCIPLFHLFFFFFIISSFSTLHRS